ncbi:TPA: BMC domain-containing protein [Streptococcus suis]|nr:BMC domain-containing protein [Streptococcus suis]
MKALGLIETYGFIGAIEAADVMLKVANISLLKLEKVRGGLVTITVEGDVGAVKIAVAAGASAVQRLGVKLLYGSHVIPRPDAQLVPFVKKKNESIADLQDDILSANNSTEERKEISEYIEPADRMVDTEVTVSVGTDEKNAETIEEKAVLSVEEYKRQLEKKKAAELRALIVNNNIYVTEEELSKMIRRKMIELLVDKYSRQLKSDKE